MNKPILERPNPNRAWRLGFFLGVLDAVLMYTAEWKLGIDRFGGRMCLLTAFTLLLALFLMRPMPRVIRLREEYTELATVGAALALALAACVGWIAEW